MNKIALLVATLALGLSASGVKADGGVAIYRFVLACDGTFGPLTASGPATLTYDQHGQLCVVGGSGGGGGGAATIADGADVAEGATTNPAWVSGAGTVIGLLKANVAAILNNVYVPGTAGTPSGQVLTTQSPTSNFVSGTTAAMTGTTTTQLIAAVASNRIYVTSMSCVNSHASVGTFVTAQDGSGGAALRTLAAGFGFQGDEANGGDRPLFRTTVGNGVFVADVTTGANVICNAAGYSGP